MVQLGELYKAPFLYYKDDSKTASETEFGGNKVLAAVYGPRELFVRRLMQPNRAVLRCKYNMAPFSVNDRKRPGPDRRSVEISKLTSDALAPAVFLEKFPRSTIDIYIEILEAEGGTRCAGITAASVALADAGIPMKDMVVACAAGKSDGNVVLDLSEIEDKEGEADLPIAMMPRSGDITLLQMDGHLTAEEFEKALDLALEGCDAPGRHGADQRRPALAGLAHAGRGDGRGPV